MGRKVTHVCKLSSDAVFNGSQKCAAQFIVASRKGGLDADLALWRGTYFQKWRVKPIKSGRVGA